MNKKVDFVNDYISGFISDNFPELSRFKIEINEDNLYFQSIADGYKHVLYVGLGHITYPNEQIVHGGFHCWTEVSIVENLLLDLVIKHGLHREQLFPTIRFNEFTNKNFNEVWDSFKQFRDYDLSTNKEKLDALCQHYKEMIKHYFIPFWEKYSDVEYINDEIIDKVPENKLNSFLPGMTKLKKLIIMKLGSNPNYDEYKKYVTAVVENELLLDMVENKPYADLFTELVEILET